MVRAVQDFWHLADIDWLSELSPAEIEGLESVSARKTYSAGELIFRPTPEAHSVYLLSGGRARIYRLSADGLETTFGYVLPGEVFGELAVIGDLRRESFAEAVEPTRAWKVPVGAMRELMESRPGLTYEITQQVGDRLRRIENRVEDLVFRDVRSRLSRTILELADRFETPDGETIGNGARFTQGELATLIGSTRQTVNACLRELSGQGVISNHDRRIRVLDREKLLRGIVQERGRADG
jgi:CRP/FNR family cyclic AMP-dependent transcriptional regulator